MIEVDKSLCAMQKRRRGGTWHLKRAPISTQVYTLKQNDIAFTQTTPLGLLSISIKQFSRFIAKFNPCETRALLKGPYKFSTYRQDLI